MQASAKRCCATCAWWEEKYSRCDNPEQTALAEVIDATTPDAELDKPCSARTTEIPQSI